MRLIYVFSIDVPTDENGIRLDEDTLADIREAQAPGDALPSALRRWLGEKIQHAEDALNDGLPDGWNVEVEARP